MAQEVQGHRAPAEDTQKAGGFIPMDPLIDSYNALHARKTDTGYQHSSAMIHTSVLRILQSNHGREDFDYLNDTKIIYGEDFDEWLQKSGL